MSLCIYELVFVQRIVFFVAVVVAVFCLFTALFIPSVIALWGFQFLCHFLLSRCAPWSSQRDSNMFSGSLVHCIFGVLPVGVNWTALNLKTCVAMIGASNSLNIVSFCFVLSAHHIYLISCLCACGYVVLSALPSFNPVNTAVELYFATIICRRRCLSFTIFHIMREKCTEKTLKKKKCSQKWWMWRKYRQSVCFVYIIWCFRRVFMYSRSFQWV